MSEESSCNPLWGADSCKSWEIACLSDPCSGILTPCLRNLPVIPCEVPTAVAKCGEIACLSDPGSGVLTPCLRNLPVIPCEELTAVAKSREIASLSDPCLGALNPTFEESSCYPLWGTYTAVAKWRELACLSDPCLVILMPCLRNPAICQTSYSKMSAKVCWQDVEVLPLRICYGTCIISCRYLCVCAACSGILYLTAPFNCIEYFLLALCFDRVMVTFPWVVRVKRNLWVTVLYERYLFS